MNFQRFELTDVERDRAKSFQELIWWNSEVCNNCFARIRSIGPTVTKTLEEPPNKGLDEDPPLRVDFYQWYERTDLASQEHTPFDNRQYGICFCLNCNSDCSASHRHKTVSELKPLAKNIFLYAKNHTGIDIDGKRFGREVKKLKSVPEYQGLETEILAIGFARSVRHGT